MPAKKNMPATTATPDAVHPGTRVLNTNDGELGTLLSAVAFDPARGWIEYEVVVGPNIEIWKGDDFVLFSEIEAAA